MKIRFVCVKGFDLCTPRFVARCLLTALMIGGNSGFAQTAPKFRPIGVLPNGGRSQAQAVSNDGTVVVGTAEDENFVSRLVRWNPPEGLKEIPLPNRSESEGQAVSSDGTVIVGGLRSEQAGQRAFRWTEKDGVQDLGSLTTPGAAFATAISGDGNIVGGWTLDERGQEQPFRWSQSTGMENLGTFGGSRGFVYDSSFDGGVLVGAARDASDVLRAFRWTRQDGKQLLPISGEGSSEARAITPDGQIIVGNDVVGAFLWSSAEGLKRIPAPARFSWNTAVDVSADGSRVVGFAGTDAFITSATLWTIETGTIDLNRAFAASIPRGWFLEEATAISENGRWVVGNAESPEGSEEGFILDISKVSIPAPEFYFQPIHEIAAETAATARLLVSHSNLSTQSVTVNYHTESGSAAEGKDFLPARGTLTFQPGETAKEILIPLLNDSDIDPDESFRVVLSNASPGMVISEPGATILITDNDLGYDVPSFQMASESDPYIELTVGRIGDFTLESSFDAITEKDTALPGIDYVTATNKIHFAAGQKQATVRIQLLNDSANDGTKSFRLRLSNPLGGIPVPDLQPIVQIEDNELGYSLGDFPVVEEGSNSAMNIYRLGDFNISTSLKLTLQNSRQDQFGTATLNEDYLPFTTNVTFAPGQTHLLVPVPLIDDHQMEPDETFYVQLESLHKEVSEPELPQQVLLRDNDINPAYVGTLNFYGHLSEILQSIPLPDGSILVLGQVEVFNNEFENFDQLLRLRPDGSVDASFLPYTTRGDLGPVAIQPDGKILIMENPTFDQRKLVRLDSNGAIDTTFQPSDLSSLGTSMNLAVQSDGKIVLSGNGKLIRILPNGTVDAGFTGPVFETEFGGPASFFPVITPNGELYVHGSFSKVDGTPRPGLARLNANGTLDTSFNPGAAHLVAVSFETDRSLLIYNSESKLVRLLPSGEIAPSFNPISGSHFLVATNGMIYSLSSETEFTSPSQEPRTWIRRYTQSGEIDTAFTPTTLEVDTGSSLSLKERSKDEFLVFGKFSLLNGQPRHALANVKLDSMSPRVLVHGAVWETNGIANITLIRTGDNRESLSVLFKSQDLESKAGVDYVPISGMATFPPNTARISLPIQLLDNNLVQWDSSLMIAFSTSNLVPVSESSLTIRNDDPGFLASELYLPWGRTLALRFAGRGTPLLGQGPVVGEWIPFENQPDKREVLVLDPSKSQMKFYKFQVQESSLPKIQ